MALIDSRSPHLRLHPVLTLVLTLCLAACSVSGPRQSPLPQDGRTVVDVYRDHIRQEGSAADDPRDRLHQRKGGADVGSAPSPSADGDAVETLPVAYRQTVDPMQQRFGRLPNPDLVMYVHPHLARGGHPVPGYLTVFPMYDRVEYAMPGELTPSQQRIAQPLTARAPSPQGEQRAADSAAAGIAPRPAARQAPGVPLAPALSTAQLR